jgi:acetate kinase
MKVLVLNAGSSSLKYQLFNMVTEQVIAKGMCERIGTNNGVDAYMGYSVTGKNKVEIKHAMPTHKEAIELMISTLEDKNIGVIANLDEIDAIGHRVLHGAETFKSSVIITEEIMEKLNENVPLGPLHMPPNIMGIKACQEIMKGKKNIAVFDTAFHQTMPDYAYMYPLPYKDYTELRVRKYGFHGTSHKFVSGEASAILNKKDSKVVICHLGNGSSVSAVKDGKCIDTSMGLTPLEGLMMGTRCGNIDPAAVLYVMEKRNMSIKEMDSYMNKQSGIVGIYEKNSDFRNVRDDYSKGDERAVLTLNMVCYKIMQYIGSYAASLGGIDAVCFTGGIGENSALVREKVCAELSFMGIELDFDKNNKLEKERTEGNIDISKDNSKAKILVIPTNEELVIARDTYELVGKNN